MRLAPQFPVDSLYDCPNHAAVDPSSSEWQSRNPFSEVWGTFPLMPARPGCILWPKKSAASHDTNHVVVYRNMPVDDAPPLRQCHLLPLGSGFEGTPYIVHGSDKFQCFQHSQQAVSCVYSVHEELFLHPNVQ